MTRDRGNGRYAHTDLDALCTCGHPLGWHSSEVVGGLRECFAADHGQECDCERFRKSRKRRAALVAGAALPEATCARCGRLFVVRDGATTCGVHLHSVAVFARLRAPVPSGCPACGVVVGAESLPGAETLCSRCGVALVFSPRGWAHA